MTATINKYGVMTISPLCGADEYQMLKWVEDYRNGKASLRIKTGEDSYETIVGPIFREIEIGEGERTHDATNHQATER